MYLVNGVLTTSLEVDAALTALRAQLASTLAYALELHRVLDCAERFAATLETIAADLSLDQDTVTALRSFCHRPALEEKLSRELGEQPFSLRRFDYVQPCFERWHPLGLVVHITPANARLLPFMATLESLLVGNVNWLRPSSSDGGFSARLLAAFLRCDTSGELARYIAVLPLPSTRLSDLFAQADAVSAWGGDVALSSIRQQIPPGCRLIEWGHRISFAYLDPAVASNASYDALADDVCRVDQQACSSPQCLLVNSDDQDVIDAVAQAMAAALARRAPEWPVLQPDIQEAAEITTQMAFLRLNQAFANEPGAILEGDGWRVAWSSRTELAPSPLFRTLQVRPVPRQRLVEILLPWRKHLQSCGVIAAPADLPLLSRQLLAAGVSRVCPVGEMHNGYHGEPHDGVYALARLARRVSVRVAADQLPGHTSLDALPPEPVGIAQMPVMDKTAFQQTGTNAKAQLFFRSGGSSGVPKLAGFSYRDYHQQMQAAADGLFAAGLDPVQDRTMNLLYGGNLYGGMLSFFTILDKLSVPQYPMGGPITDDYSEIAHCIVARNINTLIGMPSTLHRLFEREEAALRAYRGVRKIFCGGEHLNASQRQFFASFGVELMRSAVYGSVDAGPLGHACAHGKDGEFHLLASIQWLEVLAQDSDEPAAAGEIGRLVFTSLAREGQRVQRYDLGDLGRMLPGACACGLAAPRFELAGRHGTLLRIGPMFANLEKLSTQLDVPSQWLVDYADNGCSRIRVLVDGDPQKIRAQLFADNGWLEENVTQGVVHFEVSMMPVGQFHRHPQSGKTPLVLDKRR